MSTPLANLRQLIDQEQTDAMLISSLANITYATEFSGFSKEDRDAFVLITKNHEYIFTHGIYKEVVQKKVSQLEFVEITREQPIGKCITDIAQAESLKSIAFESDDLTYAEYARLKHVFQESVILKPSRYIHNVRIQKTHDEIDKIQKACSIGDQVFIEIQKNIETGMTEQTLVAMLEFTMRQMGVTPSFPTIVAFGANASQPHHISDQTKLVEDTYILLDFGVLYEGYASDMTRTFFWGKTSDEQKQIYNDVLASQQKAVAYIQHQLRTKQPILASESDHIARDFLSQKQYPPMPHSLGHGIGIEVHEQPRLTPSSQDILEDGMVFSIEPGVYIPDQIGIRIEDLYTISNNTLMQLTKAPSDLLEIQV